MNILLIDLYAGSERMGMEFRPFYMAREWQKLGHRVTLLAGSYTHLRKRNPSVARDFEEQTHEGVRYRFVKIPAYTGNDAGRGRNILAFVCKLRLHAGKLAKELAPDAVICSSTCPLDVWPGAAIARRAGAALFFEIHDLWPLTPMEMGGLSKWNPVIFTMQQAENYAYRHAVRLISILPHTDAYVRARGYDASKWLWVPNGVFPDAAPAGSGSAGPSEEGPGKIPGGNPGEVSETLPVGNSAGRAGGAAGPDAAADCPAAAQLRALRREGCFLIGYTGNHAVASALSSVLDASLLLSGEKIKWVLVGDGIDKPRLLAYARAHGCRDVLFCDPAPKACMGAVLDALDVCYMGLRRSPLFRYGVSPNKLYDYLLAGKPVIYAVDAPGDPVAEARCGISIPPEDPRALAAAARALRDAGPRARQEMGRRGRAYVTEHYAYGTLARRYLRALEDGVRETRAGKSLRPR